MMELHTGDPCPCCGKPIKTTDPEALRLLNFLAEKKLVCAECTPAKQDGKRSR